MAEITVKEKKRQQLGARDIAYMAMMAVLLEVGKIALDWAANIEIVSFLLIIFTLYFGWKVIPPVLIFATIECLRFGFGPWTVTYYYVWGILVAAVLLTKKFGRSLKKGSVLFYSILSGLFGLLFGGFCSLYTLVLGGFKVMIAWWISGIVFDLIHCAGNFVICLVLFYPVNKAMSKIHFYSESGF